MGGKAYIGGHFTTFSGQTRRFFAAANASTGALDSQWTPSGGGGKLSDYTTGVWDFAPDGSRGRLYAGTNFRNVNGQRHAGFVRFSDMSVALAVADTMGPSVTSISPTSDARQVRSTARVRAMFSEAMDPAMLNDATFTLTERDDNKPIAATVSYDGISNKATLKPSANLRRGHTYTARISTGARDVAGNALARDRIWSFTTVARVNHRR